MPWRSACIVKACDHTFSFTWRFLAVFNDWKLCVCHVSQNGRYSNFGHHIKMQSHKYVQRLSDAQACSLQAFAFSMFLRRLHWDLCHWISHREQEQKQNPQDFEPDVIFPDLSRQIPTRTYKNIIISPSLHANWQRNHHTTRLERRWWLPIVPHPSLSSIRLKSLADSRVKCCNVWCLDR